MSAVTPVVFSASTFFILPADFVHLHGQICAYIYIDFYELVLKLMNSSLGVWEGFYTVIMLASYGVEVCMHG